ARLMNKPSSMPILTISLKKYYTILFNGIADALKALDQQETSRAWDILVRIQQEAEDAYIRAEET
uniref:hypothetical protein n=1 Tax=Dysosmobacter welbionis TaxID=2093857 RepID=UPI003FEF8577